MKILILGAGQVGSSAAYHLSREEANEVTVVDKRPDVDPLKGVATSTIIARRYATLRRLHEARTPINQNAMASALSFA